MKQETFQALSRCNSPPTHANVTHFLSTLLPPCANDVQFLYHTPRHPSYDPTRIQASHIVLSISPTPGVYAALQQRPPTATDHNQPICILHRPWRLHRRALPPSTLVLASHASLDTYLTVGWNTTLASRLGLLSGTSSAAACIQGYKGDAKRKIGLVAALRADTPNNTLATLTDAIKREFAGAGELYLPAGGGRESVRLESRITAVAIMSAFHAEEVERVLEAAAERGWIGDRRDGSGMLYLTGTAREHGLEAAAIANMPVVCVGHRPCEEWGMRYLAEKLREQWPELAVEEVSEDEEQPGPKKAGVVDEGVALSNDIDGM
ncbi:hypothetical protein B0J12DRAFT_405626 [Macrophomina phaseolina]|uniref:Uncharacterized protein n=1 Tax=Macrophomina phaseolina TaxID=35725 RepID=A0ABQ8GLI2_9PEZI|nr:hypothetical protein B0J12DRAFT_405626 [Macrophomina phaseolina]